MSTEAPDAAAMLAELDTLKARSRRLAHGGLWLPALVLAALPLASIALYQDPAAHTGNGVIEYPYWAGLPEQQRAGLGSYLFWLLATPLAFALVALWYRRRESTAGVRVPWRVPVVAGAAGLLCLLALFAAPAGHRASAETSWWQGLLTPLLGVALAAIALGIVERSKGITVAGVWMAALAWQFCATGQVGGLLGWQSWVLGGGPALGGQLTVLGLDRPAPALLIMALPLTLAGLYHAARSRTNG
ncbi:hypothetical protein GCM10010168_45090 [Actinoplanes ianthinogenes]|uniref:ABC transporter permease n=1 Tax=Actinoplanes ianthinogenes TaxID=122358 RepID=A0ABN6C925_9ACTN|nr:hypothetical protein [Actinoplanes ianthinogenes]BCJ41193.1 hypothetical protein Aiant_18500 [Actinoplanes ianthinogenes]GGR22296.1 hypothetical protein GCM10010168_45090 [Actinoplanes ianthinogenes]